MSESKKYAVIVTSKEVRSGNSSVMTREGDKFIVCLNREGWVEATSSHYEGDVPIDAKIFDTAENAAEFARRWKGHPWWCAPNGDCLVIEVEPVYKQSGWKEVRNERNI